MFGNIMGGMANSAYNGAISAQQQAQSAYPYHAGGLIANPLYNLQNQTAMANNAYAQNQAAFNNAAKRFKPKEFRINGKDMDFEEFLNTLYSDDCPEKTYLALKLAKGDDIK